MPETLFLKPLPREAVGSGRAMNQPAPDLVTILLLALLPALGSILGVMLAEWRKPSRWVTGAALHGAAGIATAVVATELMPRAQERIAVWLIALAILGGAALSVLLAKLTATVRKRISRDSGGAATWGAYGAVAIDLLTDGFMTGGGGAISPNLGILLAVSQVVGNMPGGFAVTANLRNAGIAKRSRWLAMILYPAAPLVGALLGFFLLNGAGPVLTGTMLAVFAGLLLLTTIEDLVPEADEPGAPRWFSTPAFAAGFVMLMLLSAYVG